MDISLVEENKSDYTFFKIDEDEDEDNETLKALKQTYVTSNYKHETILNLQKELNTNSDVISKEIKLESYNKYNNALDLAIRNYITNASEFIEEALRLNPKDVDILNLKGLLCLLRCDFKESFESFYTAQCYGNNELSRKYVDLLSSRDVKVFFERYNHAIRFINEDLVDEAIEIFDSLILEEPDLIEPYVISILLHDKVENIEKRDQLMNDLRCVDRNNSIFEKINSRGEVSSNSNQDSKVESEPKETKEKKSNSKTVKILFAVIAVLIVIMGGFYLNSKKQIDNLNKEIATKDDAINEKDKQITENEKAKKEEEIKKQQEEEENRIKSKGAASLYLSANDYKKAGAYEDAIKYYTYAMEANDTSEYDSVCMYNIALCYERLNDTENAIKYYNRFVNTYPASNDYYDDAVYNLGMIYYNNDRIKDAQGMFYTLKIKDPSSAYNNSQVVKDILKK